MMGESDRNRSAPSAGAGPWGLIFALAVVFAGYRGDPAGAAIVDGLLEYYSFDGPHGSGYEARYVFNEAPAPLGHPDSYYMFTFPDENVFVAGKFGDAFRAAGMDESRIKHFPKSTSEEVKAWNPGKFQVGWTQVFWVKLPFGAPEHPIAVNYNEDTAGFDWKKGWSVWTGDDGADGPTTFNFHIGDYEAGFASFTVQGGIEANQWYHIATTYDGIDTIQIYVNGEAGAAFTNEAALDQGLNSDLRFPAWGRVSGPEHPPTGFAGDYVATYDELAAWNRKLSAVEIAAIWGAAEGKPLLKIDPRAFIETKLLASDGGPDDFFGQSVAMNANTAVVGAPQFVFGRPESELGPGKVWIFIDVSMEQDWSSTFETKLTAQDGAAGDGFGWALDLDGDTLVVGAPMDDDAGSASGSAYVIKDASISPPPWSVRNEVKLTAGDAEAGDEFGVSVSVRGDTAVVGAHLNDEGGEDAGAVYIFQDISAGRNWSSVRETKLLASDAADGDFFGWSVAVGVGTIVVGARHNGFAGERNGAAYIYQDISIAGDWSERRETKLSGSEDVSDEFSDWFGHAVAYSVGTVVVGARGEDFRAVNAGLAHVFQNTSPAGDWTMIREQVLAAPDGATGDNFGFSLAIDVGTIVVGAPQGDDACLMDAACDSGSAYVITDTSAAGDWGSRIQHELTAIDQAAQDFYGGAVGVGGRNIIVGAWGEGKLGPNAGAAYVYFPAPKPDGVGAGWRLYE